MNLDIFPNQLRKTVHTFRNRKSTCEQIFNFFFIESTSYMNKIFLQVKFTYIVNEKKTCISSMDGNGIVVSR